MMEVCKFDKFGYCKNGEKCIQKHFEIICNKSGCEGRNCDARHPRRCRNFARSQFCQFGSFCAYNHGVVEIEGRQLEESEVFAREKRVLEERIKKMDLQIQMLEVKEKELENRLKEAVTTYVGEFARDLIHHLYPILRRVQGLEFHTHHLRNLPRHQEVKGRPRVQLQWCGDCGAQWSHGRDLQGQPCSGELCTCGQTCKPESIRYSY